MAKAKDIRIDNMVSIKPITDNQKKAFASYKEGKNLFLYGAADRKSTRLNSSHGYISYAVFCLKKKKKKYDTNM